MTDQLAPQQSEDDRAYAELQKEFGDMEGTAPAEAPKTEAAPVEKVPEPKADEVKKDEPPKPERNFEELERNYKNLQGALSEERTSRRELAEQVRNMQALFAQVRAPQQQQQIEQDPVKVLADLLQAQDDKINAVVGMTREQREQEELMKFAVQEEQKFAARTPDYNQAVAHLVNARRQELAFMLPDGDPRAEDAARQNGLQSVAALRDRIMMQERDGIAKQARDYGRSPAEMIYAIAKARGYAPAPQQSAPPPVAQAPLETIKRGQEAANSLSGGGRASESGDGMSMPDLLDLYIKDPEAGDVMFNKMRKAGLLG